MSYTEKQEKLAKAFELRDLFEVDARITLKLFGRVIFQKTFHYPPTKGGVNI